MGASCERLDCARQLAPKIPICVFFHSVPASLAEARTLRFKERVIHGLASRFSD